MALCTFEGVVGRREGNDIGLLLCSGVDDVFIRAYPIALFFCFLPPKKREIPWRPSEERF